MAERLSSALQPGGPAECSSSVPPEAESGVSLPHAPSPLTSAKLPTPWERAQPPTPLWGCSASPAVPARVLASPQFLARPERWHWAACAGDYRLRGWWLHPFLCSPHSSQLARGPQLFFFFFGQPIRAPQTSTASVFLAASSWRSSPRPGPGPGTASTCSLPHPCGRLHQCKTGSGQSGRAFPPIAGKRGMLCRPRGPQRMPEDSWIHMVGER